MDRLRPNTVPATSLALEVGTFAEEIQQPCQRYKVLSQTPRTAHSRSGKRHIGWGVMPWRTGDSNHPRGVMELWSLVFNPRQGMGAGASKRASPQRWWAKAGRTRSGMT